MTLILLEYLIAFSIIFLISIYFRKYLQKFIADHHNFLLLLAVFFLSRIIVSSAFPIFNDEAIYIQYAQGINANFSQYKFISINNIYGDWKPPLQYWWGSIFINLFYDPVFSARFASILFSLFGFVGIYFLVLYLYGRREALWASAIFIICPPILMYNTQFVAETYVFSAATIFYLFSLLAMRAPKINYWFLGLAILSGAALLLFKQSGALYLYLGLLLSFIPTGGLGTGVNPLLKKLLLMTLIAIASFLIYKLIIPFDLALGANWFTARWTFSFWEIGQLPTNAWFSNLSSVFDFYLYYYTLAAIFIIFGFIFYVFSRRDVRDLVICFMFLVSSLSVIIGLKSFNEYIYNTAAIIFLVIILARLAAILSEHAPRGHLSRPVLVTNLVLGLFYAIMIGIWLYQVGLMKISPIKYIERSSPWMRGNYLTGWSGGFGIGQVIDLLKRQEGPALAIVDPQWGNPGTALQVYQNYYPQVLTIPLSQDFLDPARRRELHLEEFKNRFVIFSKRDIVTRDDAWRQNVLDNFCLKREEFKEYEKQTPIVVCEF